MYGPTRRLRTPIRSLISGFAVGLIWVSAHAAAPVESALRKVSGAPLSAGDGVDDVEARFDFNLDGMPDLLTCNRIASGHAVKVRLGLGTGSFSTSTSGVAFDPAEPTSVAAGFLTGAGVGLAPTDLRPDIAAAVSGTVRILSNTAGGGNTPAFAQTATLSSPGVTLREVEVADLNGDGRGDVIATGEEVDLLGNPHGRVVVFLNGAGGFDAGTVLTEPGSHAGRMAIGDLDENGSLDLVVVNRLEAQLAVYLATTPGVFGAAPVKQNLGSGKIPSGVAIGQVSGDAAPEVVVWRQEATSNPPDSRFIGVAEYRHTGSGVLEFASAIGFEPHANTIDHDGDIWIADVDFDGQNDFVFTNPVASELMIYAVKLDASGSLDYHRSKLFFEPLSNTPKRLSIANLNGDTVQVGAVRVPRLDVVTANQPVAPQRSVDVFLNGVSGDTLPVPTFGVSKPPSGPWVFRAKTATPVPNSASVRIQYSSTPEDPNSWLDLPSGVMTPGSAVKTLFTFSTQTLPLGNFAFRVVVSDGASTVGAGISKASKLFRVARKLDTIVGTILSVAPLKSGASKGRTVIFDGNNLEKVTKRVDGDQGQFVWFAMTVENQGDVADVAAMQGPAGANGFLISYFNLQMQNLTSDVVAGTLTRGLARGEGFTLLMRVRVGATLAEDTVGSFDFDARSTSDANTKDRSRAQIEVTKPKDVLFVTTTADNGDTLNATPGSMRAAVARAIQDFKKKTTIRFELPVSGPGLATIPIATELPPVFLARNVVFDGHSQVEYREAVTGTPAPGPAVELRGVGNGIGLLLQTGGCLVKELQFSNFGTGLQISGLTALGVKVKAMGNVIVGCVFEGNFNSGVHLSDGATANQIGDDSPGKSNLFVSVDPVGGEVRGNHGISLFGEDTERNRIQGNILGSLPPPSVSGADTSRGFNLAAISINGGAAGNLIGGRHTGEGNHLMGNFGEGLAGQFARGIEIVGTGTTANFVQGNTFGRTPEGVARSNRGDNVVIDLGASDNVIGGTDPGAGNLIMNSNANGIAILSTNNTIASKNRLEGNQIGGYTADEENNYSGILIAPKTSGTLIGGEKVRAGNVILGNGKGDILGGGIAVVGGSTGTFIRGNLIGADANNTVRGNSQGIVLTGATAVYIGDAKPLARNVISGNIGAGVFLNGASQNTIYGNHIGVSQNGLVAIGNGGSGIVLMNGSGSNRIGHIEGGFGNIIQENGDNGVRVEGASVFNAIRGNNHGNNAQHIPIDLVGGSEDGVGFTANDPLDADTGANDLQNSPRITAINVTAGKTKITVSFNSNPRAGVSLFGGPPFVFDVYANGAFVGFVSFETDQQGDPVARGSGDDGDGTFVLTVNKNLSGQAVTVTATSRVEAFVVILDRSTSEFSNFAVP